MAQTTIQGSFLGDATVTGAKIGADFISAQTALTSGLATTDEIIVSDAGVIKRMDISVLEIAATQITASGTLPALNGSNLTALNGTQVTSGTLPADRIADDSIVEAKLDISNGPQNGYYLQTDGSGTLTWAAVSGGVDTTGTPANNQIATFTDADTLQGEASLTFDNAALNFTRNHAGNNSINLTNSTANASASTRLTIQNTGSGAGDPTLLFGVDSQSWLMGIDNDDADKFKIAATGGNFPTNDCIAIDTSGRVGIGLSTVTSGSKLYVQKGNAVNGGGVPHSRAAFVVEHSDEVSISLVSPNDRSSFFEFCSNSSGGPGYIQYVHGSLNNFYVFAAGAENFRIYGNGNIMNGAGTTTFHTGSDARIKENIVESAYGLAEVMQLRSVKFNFAPWHSPDYHPTRIGLIAQEVESILPELVGTEEGPHEYIGYDAEIGDVREVHEPLSGLKSIDDQQMISVLIKAIQELNEKVEALS